MIFQHFYIVSTPDGVKTMKKRWKIAYFAGWVSEKIMKIEPDLHSERKGMCALLRARSSVQISLFYCNVDTRQCEIEQLDKQRKDYPDSEIKPFSALSRCFNVFLLPRNIKSIYFVNLASSSSLKSLPPLQSRS